MQGKNEPFFASLANPTLKRRDSTICRAGTTDPEIGRFINADRYASTGQGIIGCNMFAYCINEPISLCDSRGNTPAVVGDENGNHIPDYLEIRWYQQTIRASGQLNQVEPYLNKYDDGKRCAVDCSVPFSSFEVTDSNTIYLLDNPLYFYAVCKEVERLIREQEQIERDRGEVLTGSMSFTHIYQEMKYHYDGYRILPKNSSFYISCSTADLYYDEKRVSCLPMYFIEVPHYF